MSLQLQTTRAKIFINHESQDEGEQRVSLSPGRHVKVPDWVKNTLGYRQGIKDKSIVDFTPQDVKALTSAELRKALAEAEAKEAAEAKARAPKDPVVDDAVIEGADFEAAEKEKAAKAEEEKRLEAERAEAEERVKAKNAKVPTGLQGSAVRNK
jgi:hypothetical protein